MEVIFQTKSKEQEHFRMPVEGYGKLYWKKGAYSTSDKDLIKKLLRHPLKERGEYELVTNDRVVEEYLEGGEPDRLTKEILDDLTLQGIIEIGKVVGATETRPNLIKIEVEGKPITDQVQQIIDSFQKQSSAKEREEEILAEEEDSTEVVEEKLSTDMLAKEAINEIENSTKEEIKGFVPGSEDRVTVIDAYQEKMEE